MTDFNDLEQLYHLTRDGDNDIGLGGVSNTAGSVRVVSGSGFRYVVPFPYRLHKMLSDVEVRGDASICSWMPDGLHFKVHNPQRFVEEIIPNFFKQKSLKSFQRQLHLYGFSRVQDGPNKGAYWHENFVQENRDLCLSISRIKAPKRRTASQNTRTKPSAAKKADDSLTSFSPRPKQCCIPNAFPGNDSVSSFHVCVAAPGANGSGSPGQLSSTHSKNATSVAVNSGSQAQLDSSVADTYQWLLNAGVPVSAFDPVALNERTTNKTKASELLDCADEITSLFASTSPSPAYNPRDGTARESLVPAAASVETPNEILPIHNSYSSTDATASATNPTYIINGTEHDVTLPVSLSLGSSEQMHLPDLLLADGSLPSIENDNWALW